MVNLQKFLQAGGLFVCIGNACRVPIDYGLISGVSIFQSRQLKVAGSVLSTDIADKTNPALAGFGDTLGVYLSGGTLLNISSGGFGGGGAGGGVEEERASGRGDLKDADVIQGRAAYTPAKVPTDAPETPGFGIPPPAAKPKVLLKFSSADKLLISGMLAHGEELAGKPAVVLCPVGKGNVMLMCINPFWRQETIGSWPLVFNAALNFDHLQTHEAPPTSK